VYNRESCRMRRGRLTRMIRRFPVVMSIAATAFLVVFASGCGFFDVNNPENPLWGIWRGPYPTSVSTDADSARWVFTTWGFYLFYALDENDDQLWREPGYYTSSGLVLMLSTEKGGRGETEELRFIASGDQLKLKIRNEWFTYRRTGNAVDADLFEEPSGIPDDQ
jgi:hypothetical protein